MNWFELYLLTRIEAVRDVASVLLVIGMSAFAIGLCFYPVIADSRDGREFVLKTAKRLAWAMAASGFAFAALPSQRDLAIIIAGHWASNSDEMKRLPDNVVRTLNSLIDVANAKLQEK